MIVAPFRAATAAASHFTNPRAARLAEEHSKLARSLENYLLAHPSLAVLGPDPLVQQMISAKGLATEDAVVVRVVAGAQLVTVVCVPTRVWRDPYGRAALLEMKAEAAENRTRCILVPQRWIRAPLRASISRAIAMTRRVQYSARQLSWLLAHVRAAKITTLQDCAAHVPDHDDPIGVVLLLCGQGFLQLDRTRPIGPDSWIALRS